MTKKSLILISIFCLIALISSPVFAANIVEGTENTLNNIKGGVQSMVNDAGNGLERARDGISNVVNDGVNGAKTMGNDAKNAINDATAGMTDGDRDTARDYTATRTSMTETTNSTNIASSTTVWLVLAITGIIIVALIWYYGSQVNNHRENY